MTIPKHFAKPTSAGIEIKRIAYDDRHPINGLHITPVPRLFGLIYIHKRLVSRACKVKTIATIAERNHIALLYLVLLAHLVFRPCPRTVETEYNTLVRNSIEVIDTGVYFGVFFVA